MKPLHSFSLFLALRYLKPRRTFLSIITLISILGVVLGVCVLILVISVMTGFDRELRKKVLGFDPHLVVSGDSIMRHWQDLSDQVSEVEEVTVVSPFVQGPVIVEFHGRRLAPKIRGIDADIELEILSIDEFMFSGEPVLFGDQALLGRELAHALGVRPGDFITVYSPGNLGDILEELRQVEEGAEEKSLQDLRELILPAELEVTGIFHSGRYVYDSEFVLVPLHIGQELYGLRDGVHGLNLRTQDPDRAALVKNKVNARLSPPFHALSWMDLNRQFFEAIKLERTVMFFLLFFIIIVAAFGIMNTLITFTVQKTREIGIMKALGADTARIIWVFLAQGMVVGAFGTLGGLGLGMLLVQYRNEFSAWLGGRLGIEVFPQEVYQFAEIPAEVVPQDVMVICVSAFVICSLAALLPAWFAARLDPVKALRYE